MLSLVHGKCRKGEIGACTTLLLHVSELLLTN